MAEKRPTEKIEETRKIGSYNEFMRRFYPDTEKVDKYQEDSDATRSTMKSLLKVDCSE